MKNGENEDNEIKRSKSEWSWKRLIPTTIWITLLIFQFVYSLFVQNYLGLLSIYITGWIVWGICLVFAFLPFLIFKRKGGVAKGESYTKTTRLVDSGLYGIVRHPQYLAGILWSISLMLTTQHWISVVCGIPVIIGIYADMMHEDKILIDKFGEDYRRYMDRVPRANFFWGIIKSIRQ